MVVKAVVNVEFATKLLAPRKAYDVFRRQRLIDLLHANIHLCAQIVSAPAGYGKTTLLVDFANDLDIPVCWYSLDTSDQDPRLFLEGILESIRFHFPNFGQLTKYRLFAARDIVREAAHLVGTLTGEMYTAIPEYFVLVLEDYQFVEDSEQVKMLLNMVIDRAPDNCHIIVSSRTPVELPTIATLVVQQRAVNLSTSHLSFTPKEVKELLATCYGIHLSIEKAERLTAEMEGWIVGILLSAYSIKESGLRRDMLTLSRQDIFRYLVAEVYDRQPSDIQSFLLESSTLDVMKAEICDRLLGLTNSRKVLCQIERQNLFTQCIDSEKAWYRYHHLFREFLQAKFLNENPERFAFMHYNAASLLKQDQQWSDAITHFLTARRYDEVLRVINIIGEDFQNSGKWVTVSKWVETLPKDKRLIDHNVVLLYAQSLIHLGKANEATLLLTDLLGRVVSDEDWLCKAKALSWRSAAFRLSGLFGEAKADIKTAIHLLEQHRGPSIVLGDAYNRLGNIHAEQSQFTLALRYMKRALKYYSSISDLGQMAAVHNSLGIMYKRLGKLNKANMHFEHARQGCQKTKNFGSLASVLNNIGIIYQRLGQYDLALDTFRLGLGKARETGYRRMEACILISMADTLRDMDLFDEALAIYQEGLELARQVMEPYYVACAKAGIGETYRLLGDHGKAEILIKEALSEAKEQGQEYEATLFYKELGVIEYERGQYDTAKGIFSSVCDHLEKIGDKDALARTYFHLAYIWFLTKNYDLATSWLEKTCALADELGYDDFMAVEGRNAALLIQYGAIQRIGGNRFTFIMQKIKKRRDSKRSQQIIETSISPSVALTPDIKALAFGKSQVLLNERIVSEAEWRSNRAKEIFFYLLCSDNGQTKENIAAALWPELSPDRASSNFHINLYRARRAISPTVFTLDQGRYKPDSHLNIWFDISEFERLLSEAEKLPNGSEAAMANLEQAIKLYKGPFMDEFYSEWVEVRRRQLEEKYLKTLSLLANFNANKGKYNIAIELLEKYIDMELYSDEVYCQIMEWYLTSGDKISSLRVYKRYLDAVVGDLECTPSTRIRDLYKHLVE